MIIAIVQGNKKITQTKKKSFSVNEKNQLENDFLRPLLKK
jgi:hypothetical protein